MPLPPYIDRPDDAADRERYQTVYAQRAGAVAAPTAGLHFDEALLEAIRAKGVDTAFVTLHVGAGTFQPVRVERIEDHVMHREWLEVGQDVVDAVSVCRARGGRVVAVGTTSVRSLESAARDGELKPFSGDTDIFIYPGRPFHVVDALVTNFHLPESTLLMLVSAFAGYPETMAAYAAAWAGPSPLAADAVTASPYLGFGSLEPLLETAAQHRRGVFVLAATSNPEGASVQRAQGGDGRTVAQAIVDAAAEANRAENAAGLGSIGVVVGATLREVPDLSALGGPVLVPGVGAQGGRPEALAGLGGAAAGTLLPAVSREVLRAGPDKGALRAAAERLRDTVAYLAAAG